MILAGIVLYNPELDRLHENLQAVLPQVDLLLLVENGSNDRAYLKELEKKEKIHIIHNSENKGSAYALNQILGYAYANDIPWVLTLDQDSVVQSNIIETYQSLIADNIGIISCWIEDRNYKTDESFGISRGLVEIGWCFTSASYTNTKVWYQVGGFDNRMFIDWVDWDYGIAVRSAGYKIIRTYNTKLVHELGNVTNTVKVRNRDFIILNRPSFRYYYVFRNRIYMSRKYDGISLWSQIKETILEMYVILRYERNKCKNLWAIVQGLCVGFVMPVGNPLACSTFIESWQE